MSWHGGPEGWVPRLQGLLVVGVPCRLEVLVLVWGGVLGAAYR